MKKIETLIQELCPEGVAFKALDEVLLKIRTGLNPRQNFVLNPPGASNYYVTVRELAGMSVKWDTKTDRIDDHGLSLIQARSQLRPGDVLFSATGTVGRTALVSSNPVNWNIKEGVYALTPKAEELDSKFLIYLLTSQSIRNGILANTNGSTVQSISMANLVQTRIPVPPLKVQQELVSILDKFTELEKELEKELEARKRQFNYFVDELTSAGTASRSGGLTCLFGDLGEFFRGSGLQKSDLSDEGAPALHYGQIFTYYKTKIHSAKSMVSPKLAASIRQAQHGDVIIATTSENIEDVCKSVVWLGDGDLAVGGETYIFKHELDPLYATYVFRSSDFQYQKLSHISGTKVKRVSGKALEKMTVSVPDREAQVRIGSFLSQLEDLLVDVREGLPAEIQARRKQYEYYRNKLLTFKELEAV